MMKRDSANIIRSFIAHKKLIYIVVIGFVVVGIAGLFFINKDEFPSFEIKQGLVAGIYPGASAAQVEDQLTKPLEEVLFSFTEVDRENTYSYSRDGICYIFVDLTVPAKKKDEAWSKIKLRLESAKMTLPAGVLAVSVLDDFSAVSSLLIAIESSDKGYSELREYAEDLRSRLLEIPEMANVSIIGAQTEEIAVDVDMAKLSSYGISPATLLLDYQTAGLQVPGGTFKTDYVNSPMHIASPLTSEQEVAERIIYSDPAGNVVRLGDVAEVTRRYKDPTSSVNYNGNAAIILSVEKRLDNDIVAFGAKVNKVLSEFTEDLPQSVTVSRITDQPKVVGNSVISFLRDLVISMLVVILVMLMLFPIKSALIASSGVPVCTALALAVMFIAGIDLNASQHHGAVNLNGLNPAFSCFGRNAAAPGWHLILADLAHIPDRSVNYHALQATDLGGDKRLSAHTAHVSHAAGITHQHIAWFSQIVDFPGSHFDKIVVYQTLSRSFFDGDAAQCDSGSHNQMARLNGL